MKFIQRLIILGLLFAIVLLVALLNLPAVNLIICRQYQIDGGYDENIEGIKSIRSGGRKGREDPEVAKLVRMKLDKLREIVQHKQKIFEQQQQQQKQKQSVWAKIIKPTKTRDRHLIPFHRLADQRQLYSEAPLDQKILEELLNSLATSPIVGVAEIDGGTQIKLNFTLADGTRALFKPARFGRDATANPNHFYFSDMERHISEIAAHHLDRLLGFRRVPPCTGRLVNLTEDVMRLAEDELYKTFFISPVGNVCFMSHCDYYCDSAHAICGNPDQIEGSMCVYLASQEFAPREKVRHPWRRSYSKHRRAEWETDDSYCQNVTSRPMYARNQRRRLDLIDMAVFDFLISNLDRHHYETFEYENDDSFTIMLDNGKGFGQPDKDEISILAPLYQCCFIRLSTLHTLLRYHDGPEHLSDAMRKSLTRDRLPEVLIEGHLSALDRRLRTILTTVYDCLNVDEKTQSYSGGVIVGEAV